MVITIPKLYKSPMLVIKNLLPGILSRNFFFLGSPFFFSLLINFFSPVYSSGDSVGVSPEDQKKRYDAVVARKPNNILSLEHEVYGMFFLTFFFFLLSM